MQKNYRFGSKAKKLNLMCKYLEEYKRYFMIAPMEYFDVHYGKMKEVIDNYSHMASMWYKVLPELKPPQVDSDLQRRADALMGIKQQDRLNYPYKLGYFLKKKVLPDCPKPQEELLIVDLTQPAAQFVNDNCNVFNEITDV